MSDHFDFSVVIPTFNSRQYIVRAIDSVGHAAEGMSYEIIIVDDQSCDISEIRSLLSKDIAIKLIEKEVKTNAADSRNIGIDAASGRFIFFLDSDDYFLKGHIKRRIKIHEENGAGVVFGNYSVKLESALQGVALPSYKKNKMRDYLFSQKGDFRSSTISLDKYSYKKTKFDALQYKHQDWGFAIRACDQQEVIVFDSARNVIIDNCSNPNRMSNNMNVQASSYFISRYLVEDRHVIAFAKAHIRLALKNNDKLARNFLREIFIGCLMREKSLKKAGLFMMVAALTNPLAASLRVVIR